MNLVASMGKAVRSKASHPRAIKYDCGRFGMLSVPQIAAMAGISHTAVIGRLKLGWKGADLCRAKLTGRTRKMRSQGNTSTMIISLRMADKFTSGIPTLEQIMGAIPMSYRNAERWQAAFIKVRGYD